MWSLTFCAFFPLLLLKWPLRRQYFSINLLESSLPVKNAKLSLNIEWVYFIYHITVYNGNISCFYNYNNLYLKEPYRITTEITRNFTSPSTTFTKSIAYNCNFDSKGSRFRDLRYYVVLNEFKLLRTKKSFADNFLQNNFEWVLWCQSNKPS